MIWHLHYFLKEALQGLRGNASATVISTVTIALTMLLFGLFFLMYQNLNTLVGSLRQEIKIILYVKEDISKNRLASLRKKLEQQPAVAEVSYTSKENALENFRGTLEGSDLLLKGLGENPLPASFELTLEKGSQSSAAIQRLAGEMGRLDGIDDVQYGREWVENVNAVLRILRVGGALGGAILGLAAVVIISGTIGLMIWARLSDIEVLKLIGATRMYVQIPFLLEGMFMGLLGGGLSILLLWVVYGLIKSRLVEMGGFFGSGLTLTFLSVQWLVGYLFVGVGLGLSGSYISLRRLL